MGKPRTLANLVSGASTSTLPNSALTNSAITINGSSVSLGGSVTIQGETRPTFSSISPSVIENTQTTVTISGGNFVSVPLVTAINSSTGALIVADEVSFSSASSITAKFTISVDGTYLLYIENPDGNAVQTSAVLTVSDAPAWTTAAGSLGSFSGGDTISVTVAATNATSFSKTSGTFPGGLSLNTSSGVISGTESGTTSDTTFSFTIRATDAQGQTADRAFTMVNDGPNIVAFSYTGSAQTWTRPAGVTSITAYAWGGGGGGGAPGWGAVSYTHLTLPTICSV